MRTIAVYAGSFDPITRGHEDLIRRCAAFADELIVAVASNSAKAPLFTVEERMALISESLDGQRHVSVQTFEGLLVDFVASVGARLIVRGLRAVSDFEYEFQMALMNRRLGHGVETVFMVPSVETTFISSSIVREIARYGGELGELVHPAIAKALRGKFPR